MEQHIATGPENRGMMGFCFFFPPLGISNVLGVIARKFFDPIRGLVLFLRYQEPSCSCFIFAVTIYHS